MLEKLKGFRTIAVVLLGLGPAIGDALNVIEFDSGELVLWQSLALAAAGVLRVFTKTAIFNRA